MVSVLPILKYGKVNGGLTALLETLAYLPHRLDLNQSDCISGMKGPDSHDVVGPSSPLPIFTMFEILQYGKVHRGLAALLQTHDLFLCLFRRHISSIPAFVTTSQQMINSPARSWVQVIQKLSSPRLKV